MGLPCPRYVQLYPTTRCNQRCLFCFNTASAASPDIPDLTFDKALRLLDILSDCGVSEIDVMGGEPLLLSWMPDFMAAAMQKGLSANISTNGSIPGALRKLSGLDSGRVNVGISLESGDQKKHDSLTRSHHFQLAMGSIRELVAMEMDPIVKTVVMRGSVPNLQHIVDILLEAGVTRYYLIHMDLLSRDPLLVRESLGYNEFLGVYERLKRDNPGLGIFKVNASCFERNTLPEGVRCAGGVLKLSILPDGSVYPCNLLHSVDGFSLGNIFDGDLNDIWSNPRLDFFREFKRNHCLEEGCPNRASCTGGCPAHGIYHYGMPDMRDIRCVSALAAH